MQHITANRSLGHTPVSHRNRSSLSGSSTATHEASPRSPKHAENRAIPSLGEGGGTGSPPPRSRKLWKLSRELAPQVLQAHSFVMSFSAPLPPPPALYCSCTQKTTKWEVPLGGGGQDAHSQVLTAQLPSCLPPRRCLLCLLPVDLNVAETSVMF